MNPQKRKVIMGGVAIAAFVIAGVLLIRNMGAASTESTSVDVNGVCLACKKEVQASYPLVPAPHQCPQCSAVAVYPWMYCRDCEMRFVPELEVRDGVPRIPMIPRCPKCGGGQAEPWYPGIEQEFETTSKGDLPLPKWPPQ